MTMQRHQQALALKNVAIVGATGAVGAEFIECLTRRAFPVKNLQLLASRRSAGRSMILREHLGRRRRVDRG